MIFNKESDFEEALIKILSEKGWEKEVLKNYSEQDLLQNWANILFENNRDIDRLNDYPLTDGEMQQILEQIKNLRTPLKLNGFPKAIFFGFTGTPIQDENQKKKNTTTTVFGNELHRYSIADGIRDKNVLGFDPYKVLTFKDKDVRKVVALEKAKAQTEEEAISDPLKSKVYYKYMDAGQVGMVGHFDNKGDYIKGIEDYIPNVQYQTEEHTTTVVKDILENWVTLSHNSKFHAIFATSSIISAVFPA